MSKDEAPEILYHYTGHEGLIGIVASKTLCAYGRRVMRSLSTCKTVACGIGMKPTVD
ncbi:MAG: hypothetical protein GW893_02995 [Armatimonadetes bacterium]|nr:hypothetical protein [Armatimonadota bacterium]